jgi:hypothetical protein
MAAASPSPRTLVRIKTRAAVDFFRRRPSGGGGGGGGGGVKLAPLPRGSAADSER